MIEFLITPTEAARLAEFIPHNDFLKIWELCKSIIDNADNATKNDRIYYTMWAFNAIFNAGRIQGIREEEIKLSERQPLQRVQR